MKKIYDFEVKDFLQQLDDLAERGYVFRGQADPRWQLQPSVFRDILTPTNDEEKKLFNDTLLQHFPEFSDENQILSFLGEDDFKKLTRSTNRHFSLELREIIGNRRREILIQLVRFLMNHGYHLAKFHEKNQKPDGENQKLPDDKDKDKDPDFWKNNKRTFDYFLSDYINSLTVLTFEDGQSENLGTINNTLCMFDETHAQHYYSKKYCPKGTTLLDWTPNPRKALYFALEKPKGEHFSIIALNPKELTKYPIKILEGNPDTNKRLKAQQGCFTSFTNAAEFFISWGRWPILKDYINSRTDFCSQTLKSYILPASTRAFFKKELKRHNINKKTLLLSCAFSNKRYFPAIVLRVCFLLRILSSTIY